MSRKLCILILHLLNFEISQPCQLRDESAFCFEMTLNHRIVNPDNPGKILEGWGLVHTEHIPHFCNNAESDRSLSLDRLINESAVHRRIGRNHDALSFMGNRLPDFLGDEWHERMQESQQRFEALADKASRQAALTCTNLIESFEPLLRLLHPFMPFITEEIWQAIP